MNRLRKSADSALCFLCAALSLAACARSPRASLPAGGAADSLAASRRGEALAGAGAEARSLALELAGESYEGRLAGSAGGTRAGDLLAARLRAAGLAVEAAEFPFEQARFPAAPRLELIPAASAAAATTAAPPAAATTAAPPAAASAGPAERSTKAAQAAEAPPASAGGGEALVFRRDFRETVRGGYPGGEVAGPLVLAGSPRDVFPAGAVLVLPGAAYAASDDDLYRARGAIGLLIEALENGPAVKPLSTALGPRGARPGGAAFVKFLLAPEAWKRAAALAADKGGARLSNPVEFRAAKGRNIIAGWNGDGGAFDPALVLVAHYDHVGADPDGQRFPGGLDNASGAALAVVLAERFARARHPRDLAFILTDAEETDLAGASAAAARPPFALGDARVVNLDMLGAPSRIDLSVYSNGDARSLALAKELVQLLGAEGLGARSEYPVPTVDHAPFAFAGAAAATICEFERAVYHTKADFAERLDPAELDAVAAALWRLSGAR
ncbi:MAG: M28 family peptidase [Spirochaetaceae bacterium]|nr:M28 family peptidase [Spirochaetaceae bacterium]